MTRDIEFNKSDVLDAVQHEHEHLKRMFEDIQVSFRRIASGDVGDLDPETVVENAAENLELALDEMLEHFNEEEEVLFVEIEQRHPDVKPEIKNLVESHESMCEKTRWLKQQLNARDVSVFDESEKILDVIGEMIELLEKHTDDEQHLFSTVLEQVPVEERKWLLGEMKKI